MKKYIISMLFLLACGNETKILPPNEYQYDICKKAIECSIIEQNKIDNCVKCVDSFLQESDLDPKQIRDLMIGQQCDVVDSYAKSTNILTCTLGE